MPRTVMVALVGALLPEIAGPLTQASAEYLDRGLRQAAGSGGGGQAAIVILQIDTPGGSVDVMNRMVQAIRRSSVPVVVCVAPRGGIAGGPGTNVVLAGQG